MTIENMQALIRMIGVVVLFSMLALLFDGGMITQAVAEDIEEDNDKDWSRYGAGNIRLTTESGEEIQITDSGRDDMPKIMHATVILDPYTGKLRRMLDLNRPR